MREWTTCPMHSQSSMVAQLSHRPYWSSDRWSWLSIKKDAFRDWRSRLRDKLYSYGFPIRKGNFSGGTFWPGGPKPRTCSYCGGAHPADVIQLMRLGWEVEPTSKPYKRYLHPKGYSASVLVAKQSNYKHWYGPHSPVPPVKFYVGHFSREQKEIFNSLVQREEEHGYLYKNRLH